MSAEPLPPGFLDALAEAPATLGALVKDLSEDQLRAKQSADEFSILENICHLRDIEIEGYGVRISRILGEKSPTLSDIDGALLAIQRDYNRQRIDLALDQFRRSRLANVQLVRELDETSLIREGKLEGVGTITLHHLLCMMSEHDESHLADVRTLRDLLLRYSPSP